VLAKHDPELMRWFEDMTARPYATVAKYNEAEAKRESLSAIRYGEAEHALNPFRGDNETAKAEFVRRDPELAKFCQEEAKDVSIPLFGKNRNMTVIARLAKSPDIAALVQLGAQIHEHWLAEDRAAAQQARAAAEETLKRLERAAAA